MRVLTLNCGSSSVKADLLEVDRDTEEIERLASARVDITSDEPGLLAVGTNELHCDGPVRDHDSAFRQILTLIEHAGLGAGIDAAGHRVVHGGIRFTRPVLLTDDVIKAIEDISDLAPLHNTAALAVIKTSRSYFGGTFPMVATFDSGYYAELPDVAATYALPRWLSKEFSIRRYGFHGLAHRYMVDHYRAQRPDLDSPRVISLQLGNGCSVTASRDGRPIDTSMGFTPLEGLIMGTRSGDIDPTIPLHLVRTGMSSEDVDELLNKESGLLGLSGVSNDMRTVISLARQGHMDSDLAVRAFCYRARKYVGAYMATLGGVDGVVFGGGIGENAPEIRQAICEGLEWAGLALDPELNNDGGQVTRRISDGASHVDTWVIQVDEASVIARDVVKSLQPPS